jgi:acyl-CoA reductase-like NAD-dependent aldehyde dehydrogenase
MQRFRTFLGGQFVDSHQKRILKNLYSGKEISVFHTDLDQVQEAISVAKRAFAAWSLTSTKERQYMLK